MEFLPLLIGSVAFAVFAVRAVRLLHAALWLAGVSILISLMLYRLGAWEIAIIELSVGAGLVTVLFVFAIAVIGDEAVSVRSLTPKSLAAALTAAVLILLCLFLFPLPVEENPTVQVETTFAVSFWQDRVLDALLQVMLIFAGVLGVMGLLDDPKPRVAASSAAQAENTAPHDEESIADSHLEEERV